MMPVMKHLRLYPVELLPIYAIGLTPDVVFYTCCRHQVPFIGRVDEHFGPINRPAHRSE